MALLVDHSGNPLLTDTGASLSDQEGTTGVSAATWTLTSTVVGAPDKTGTAAATWTYSGTAAGVPDVTGTAAATWTFSGAVQVKRVPFAPTAYWNQSFADKYGSNAATPIHPDSDLIIESMRRQTNFPGAGIEGTIQTGAGTRFFKFRSDPTQYTYPVYIVTASTPMATVAYSGVRAESNDTTTTRYTGGGTISVPVDPTWKPSAPNYAINSGSDSQVIIWDRDNVLGHADGPQFWDFWHCSQTNTGVEATPGTWATNGSGHYMCVNCSHFTGELTSSGIPSATPDAYVSRGAGVPYIAGLVQGWELEAATAVDGSINHALAFAYASPDNTFVPPASKSDGSGIGEDSVNRDPADGPYSGPEGFFLKLADHFDVDSLPTAAQRVVARAMRDYGMVAIDNTSIPKFYLESDLTAGYTSTPTAEFLAAVPMEAFVVVDWNEAGSTEQTFSAGLVGGSVSGSPAVLGTVTGNTAGSSATVTSASQTPSVGELVLSILAEKGNDTHHVTDTTGNGMTYGWEDGEYRSYAHTAVWTTGQKNIWLEVAAAEVPSGTSAGAVTATTTNSASDAAKALQVLRLTAGLRPVRVTTSNVEATDNTTPTVTMLSPGVGSLILGVVAHRLGTASASGWTTNSANTVGGSGGNRVSLSTFTTTSTGADVTFAPTLSSATEWSVLLIELSGGVVTGVAAATFTFTAAAAGVPDKTGTASATYTLTATADGTPIADVEGSAAATWTITARHPLRDTNGDVVTSLVDLLTHGGDELVDSTSATLQAAEPIWVSGVGGEANLGAPRGSVAATWLFVGALAGIRDRPGTATATWSFTATTVGAPDKTGTAAGTFNLTATAAGVPSRAGAAAATWALTASATGGVGVTGAAAATYTFTGSVAAVPDKAGTAAATWTFTAHADVPPAFRGAAEATFAFIGAVEGDVDVTGTAAATFGFTGSVSGATEPRGAATATWAFTGTADGQTVELATAAATWTLTASVTGVRDTPASISAAWTWTGVVTVDLEPVEQRERTRVRRHRPRTTARRPRHITAIRRHST